MAIRTKLISCTIVGLVSMALGGCQSLGVNVWERDILARSDMQFAADDLELITDDHFYFSKEAAPGGRSFAGGGCGCN